MKAFQMWAVRSLLAVLSVAVFSPAAFGGYDNGSIITMRLTDGGSPWGIGPYSAAVSKINGVNTVDTLQVVCDSVNSHTQVNQDYQFIVHDMNNLAGAKFIKAGTATVTDYFQAAWLTGQLLDLNAANFTAATCFGAANLGDCKTGLQNAIWDVFSNNITPDSPAVSGWKSRALSQNLTAADVASFRILTPWNVLQPGVVPTDPQEFIIRTPEGSAFALLGVNMLGLVGLVRLFRRRQSS